MILTSIIIFGILIGLILGLFGGGGALFTIPVLGYFFHFSLKQSISTSLLLTMAGSITPLILYFKNKEVNLWGAFRLGIGGLIGSYTASVFSETIDSNILFFILISLMVISAYFMIIDRDIKTHEPHPSSLQVYFIGLFIGILTGLVGVGGGFMLIPALILLCKVETKQAIATSLAVIFSNSLFGFLAHRSNIDFSNQNIFFLAICTVFGSVFGFILNHKLNSKILKKTFGFFLIVLIILMLLKPIN